MQLFFYTQRIINYFYFRGNIKYSQLLDSFSFEKKTWDAKYHPNILLKSFNGPLKTINYINNKKRKIDISK